MMKWINNLIRSYYLGGKSTEELEAELKALEEVEKEQNERRKNNVCLRFGQTAWI